MINILIDCANREVRVDRDGTQYAYYKADRVLAVASIVVWQLAHDLAHKFDEYEIQYFGVTPDGRELNTRVDIRTQAFCLLMDNFGGENDLVVSQTNLAIQLLIHGTESKQT